MIHPRPWLTAVPPYRPGRHATTADGSMASNESPLGASPHVARAIAAAAGDAHRYPDPLADALRADLARLHDVDPDQILVGNGSDELIFLLARAYLAHGGHAVCADPAYRMDEISSVVVDARLTRVPLRDWAHDLDAMARVDADIAYVVNPHNPTGTAHPYPALARFAEHGRARLTVFDEAYVDFADDPDATTALPLAREGRAAVLRTFSKIHGLAGLRVGYLVAGKDVIETLRAVRAPFSVSGLAQAAALAALRDTPHRDAVREHTLRRRAELTELLTDAGRDVVPSQANFVLAGAPDEDAFVDALAGHGVSVRPGSGLGVPGTVRISVPTTEGMNLLRKALSSI